MRRGSARALVARYRSLQDPAARRARGLFVAEGIGPLIAALESPHRRIVEVAFCPTMLDDPSLKRRLQALRRAGVAVEHVDRATFRALSDSSTPSGVALLLARRWTPLGRVGPGLTEVHIAVRSVRSRGNLGTLLRSLEAVSGGALIALDDRIDPFSADVLRGSMGAVLRRPLVRCDDGALRRWCDRRGLRIVGGSPRRGAPFHDPTAVDHPLQGPAVLLLGDERRGLSPGDEALCDAFVHIPIAGSVDSLNLGVAGSILVYEAWRRQSQPYRPAVRARDGPQKVAVNCTPPPPNASSSSCIETSNRIEALSLKR